MKTNIITKGLWETLTSSARSHKGKSLIAVAYFGNSGASMLPLKKGSKLVVDASEPIVSCGLTCPAELIKLYKKGVHIYSLANLHAKIYVFGSKLFIGSCNISNRSSKILQEAMFTSLDKNLVKEACTFIEGLCSVELGPERLKQLEKIYRPPRIPGYKSGSKRKLTLLRKNLPPLHIVRVDKEDFSEGHEQTLKKGTANAKKKRILMNRHILVPIEFPDNFSAKEGDIVLQITDEDGKELVSPPGYITHIEKFKKQNNRFVFVEEPVKRRRSINTMAKLLDKKQLYKEGKKSKEFAEKVLAAWK